MRFHPYFHAFAHGGPRHAAHGLFRRHGRPGGGPRMFEQGDLRLIVLKLISEKPSHGYEIIKAIEDRLGGAYAPSPGVIYPTLTLLEEMGAIRVQETDGPRKLYAITPEGEEMLRQNQAAVEAIFAAWRTSTRATAAARPREIIRAMENLRTALRLRLSRGPLGARRSQRSPTRSMRRRKPSSRAEPGLAPVGCEVGADALERRRLQAVRQNKAAAGDQLDRCGYRWRRLRESRRPECRGSDRDRDRSAPRSSCG